MWLEFLRDFQTAGTYSWGSACLAWLYRQLCEASTRTGTTSNLSGCVFLLSVWMWMRLPVGRPLEVVDAYVVQTLWRHVIIIINQ